MNRPFLKFFSSTYFGGQKLQNSKQNLKINLIRVSGTLSWQKMKSQAFRKYREYFFVNHLYQFFRSRVLIFVYWVSL